MKLLRKYMVLAFLLFLVGSSAFAQVGTIRGEVKDEQGNPVKDVVVRIQGLDSSKSYEVKTDKDGKFFHGGISLQGRYRVSAQKDGLGDIVDGVTPSTRNDATSRGVNLVLRRGQAGATEEQKQKQAEAAKKLAEARKVFEVGLQLFNEGKYQEAVDSYKQALAQAEDQPYIWANLGQAHAKIKQYNEAIEAFNKALTLKTDDPALYQNLGNVYAEMGEVEKAKETFEKAASMSATTNPKDAANNYYNMGVTYINSGKSNEAIEALEKALAADPLHPQAHYQLGVTLIGVNKMAEGIDHLKKFLELSPTGGDAEVAKELIKQLSAN
ncbi:MAG: tetratricopeptide repeat protein [Acidobacteria bacterium]|nr:tetratricopeptide repeat protein [Acidobacteriota bacterium]